MKKVNSNLIYCSNQIKNKLKNKTYTLSSEDYIMFEKNDRGKLRKIYKMEYFPHRIIQWALMLQIQDILLKSFIDNTFASIPRRGIHLCLQKLDYALTKYPYETLYCLKCDIKKFYPSINHEINKLQYRRIFKDKDLLYLIDTLIDSLSLNELGDIVYLSNYNDIEFVLKEDDMIKINKGEKGVAIGSLFSQWDGNFYLSSFDRWVKEQKKAYFYFRYCDDIVILHHSKQWLHELRKEIEEFLFTKLDLYLKENYQIFPVDDRGIDFVGYRHFRNYILLRKSTAKNLKRKMCKINSKINNGGKLSYSEWCSINSYKGWLKWCDGYNLYEKHIKLLEPYCKEYYLANIWQKRGETINGILNSKVAALS